MLTLYGYSMLWSCSTSQNILLTHFSTLLAFLDFWGSSDSSVWSVITDLDASNRGSVWADSMVAYPCSIAISENRFPTYFVPKRGVARLLCYQYIHIILSYFTFIFIYIFIFIFICYIHLNHIYSPSSGKCVLLTMIAFHFCDRGNRRAWQAEGPWFDSQLWQKNRKW